jgi:hypothetical protein
MPRPIALPRRARLWPFVALQVFALVGLALFALGSARAEDDPPGRVGWISLTEGQVDLEDIDERETIDEPRNWPVTSGDALSTAWGARAEVQIGSTHLRLDHGSRVVFNRIDDEALQFTVERGSVAMQVHSPEVAREIELYAGGSRFRPLGVGLYRIDRLSNDAAQASAIEGELRYESRDASITVRRGQRAEIDEGGPGSWRLGYATQDDFARWADEMSQLPAPPRSTRGEPVGVPIGGATAAGTPVGVPVSLEMTGATQLYRYGQWQTVSEYGAIWFPTDVAADWAPYRHGRWAWVRPWGWTWIDAAPWGFAPFHYGRWVWWGNRWGWVPGTYEARPVYAPALVGWVGAPGVSVSVTVGAPPVGWFPLAPREVYVPVYRCTPRYVQRVNITHVTRIGNVDVIVRQPQLAVERYRYRYYHDEPRAVSALPVDAWSGRRPVARPVPARDIGWEPRPWRDPRDRRERDRPSDGPRIIAAPILAPGLVPDASRRRPVAPPPVVSPREPVARPLPDESRRPPPPRAPVVRTVPSPREYDPPQTRIVVPPTVRVVPSRPAPVAEARRPRVEAPRPRADNPAPPDRSRERNADRSRDRQRDDNPGAGNRERPRSIEKGNGRDDERRWLKRQPGQAPD